jgi:predicted RNA-binding protein YlxR (DUF448 family)
VLPKRALVRLVRRPEGVQIDPTGKLAGRGAYLHASRSCWKKGLKGPLEAALKVDLTPDDKQRLQQYMLTLDDEPSGGNDGG